jgi:polar amino acid transport system permease protein
MELWSWERAGELLPALLDGFKIILMITVISSIIALVLGLIVAVVNRSAPRGVTVPLFAVTEFIRNTPLLVQLIFVWYGFAGYLGDATPEVVGAIVLGVHYATYTAEVYRAGIEGVPVGQWEAITALSLPKRYAWQNVILPQAIRRVTPALGNYIISMFKEVPILFAIGAAEMISAVQAYTGRHFTGAVEGYIMAGLIFLAASYPVAISMRRLEKRLES